MQSTGPFEIDLTPEEWGCLRCGNLAAMRFAGLCGACTTELHERYATVASDSNESEATKFEPSLHVTPNAVALKDD